MLDGNSAPYHKIGHKYGLNLKLSPIGPISLHQSNIFWRLTQYKNTHKQTNQIFYI